MTEETGEESKQNKNKSLEAVGKYASSEGIMTRNWDRKMKLTKMSGNR